ncbi:NADH-ubiquinone oxidoreductase-F iron-sulfur binding region domain-containing protein [Streptomyces mirabilis]|uniref:NADH-ubiquinone oxidoreductase-F iron-sulfur binding region domain-containing protein n=1 Tax=Streptomyces mirabilis TaxID=68239 RepID=UPI0007658C4D
MCPAAGHGSSKPPSACRCGTREDIARWAGFVEGRGACHHPDGTVRLVRSALRTFAAELDVHAAGHCTATDHSPLLPVPANRN